MDIFSFITNRLRHEGAPHRGWSFWHGDRGVTAAAAVSLVPNVSLCCCSLNLQCNTITRLLEAGRSVLSDRTVSTVPPLASYWPRRGWICLHTNITTLQHYITTLHYNVTPLHEGAWSRGLGLTVRCCEGAWCQQPGVMETRSGSLLVVSVRSAHGHQCHEEARVTCQAQSGPPSPTSPTIPEVAATQ